MLNKYTVQLMALGIVGSFAANAVANDSALIDALVKKGVLKSKEAEQIRAEAAKGNHDSAGKLNLDSSVKSLTLSGDIRARYNYASGTGVNPNQGGQGSLLDPKNAAHDTHTQQQSFYDIRLRINADYKVSDDFYAGFGLRTQRDARNDNSLMGSNRTGANGAGLQDFGIGIYRAFLGWDPVEGVSLVAGAQKNPFYTTDLVWDADINPTGFSQKVDLSKVFGFSGIDLSLVSGQFVLQDNDESLGQNATNNHQNRDAFLWQTQLVAAVDLGGAKLTVAPGYLSTNGAHVGTPLDTRYTSDTQVLLLPGDISGEIAGIKAKFEWDFAYNIAGDDRSEITNTPSVNPGKSNTADEIAWLLGVRLGENKKKGDFSVVANYRRTGAGALPHVLSDNEFAFGDSRNMGGFKVGAAYSVSDSAYFGVNYLKFERISNSEGRNNIGFATGEWLQAEVGVKF